MSNHSLAALLTAQASFIGPVVPVDLNGPTVCRLDFTRQNPIIANTNLEDTTHFAALVNQMLARQNATVGIGGYLENRDIYRRSSHFYAAEAPRSIHLGVDIWMPALTPVMAPLPGRVHSFADNRNFGDYGPTIILEHQLNQYIFYTLYGHLTLRSLADLHVGKLINKGEVFTQLGPYPENGDWPPHLHLQLITDLLGQSGDFPGVCTALQQDKFAKICLDPNLLLKCKYLEEDFSPKFNALIT